MTSMLAAASDIAIPALPGRAGALIIAAVLILLFLLVATATQHRRYSSQTQQKLCRGCGAGHPNFAAFCRRCGRKL
jgi:ribosomal protein L40E